MTQSELKELTNLGAELGAAKAEVERLRGLLEELHPYVRGCSPELLDRYHAALSQQAEPVEPAPAPSYKDDPRTPAELSNAGCRCVRFGEGNPHWPCRIHAAPAQDEREAFEAFQSQRPSHWRITNRAAWQAALTYAAEQARPAQTEQQPSTTQQVLDLILEECRYWQGRDEVRRGGFACLYAKAKEIADNAAPIAQSAPQPSEESLVQNAKALLALDERGALAPHGIGGLAREVIEKLIAHVERTTPQPEQSALSGKCWIEVIGGREGPSIYIGDGEIAHRLAGNKPWGGGTTLHRFTVDILELVREATALSAQGASK